MKYTKILYEQANKQRSQLLRKNQTKEEGKLWHLYLKKYEVRFTRQKLIGNYIVDFYCHKAKLVIEIDGSQHYEEENKIYDWERTEYFEKIGLKVLRFTNWDINHNIREVCWMIDDVVKKRIMNASHNAKTPVSCCATASPFKKGQNKCAICEPLPSFLKRGDHEVVGVFAFL